MTISKVRFAAPRSQTLRAIAVVLFAMVVLETVRVVLFRTILLDQPVGKVATIALMCAALVKVVRLTCLRWGCIRAVRIAGFIFACAGAFVGYLPAVMISGRPAYAHITPMELVFAVAGALAGGVCFLTISSRSWRRSAVSREITLR
jgi:hypothetical protein